MGLNCPATRSVLKAVKRSGPHCEVVESGYQERQACLSMPGSAESWDGMVASFLALTSLAQFPPGHRGLTMLNDAQNLGVRSREPSSHHLPSLQSPPPHTQLLS